MSIALKNRLRDLELRVDELSRKVNLVNGEHRTVAGSPDPDPKPKKTKPKLSKKSEGSEA